MSLSIGTLDSLLQAELGSYSGPELPTFTGALAKGFVDSMLILNGTVASPSGSGPSTGTGITVGAAAITSTIKSECITLFSADPNYGGEGPALQDFCDAVGQAISTHALAATLSGSTNGTVTFPAFSGAISAMSAAMQAAAPSFTGTYWAGFCTAISTGICSAFASSATGSLAGAGAGTGSGVVTIT